MIFAKQKTVPEENLMNAVIYARYSSNNQTENSIDGQLHECRKFADYHGYVIIGTYIDRAKSGTSVESRDEFLKMIADAKKQQFAYVIVYRFDRFTRNRYDSVIYKKELANSGVRVISTCENVGMGDEAIILESIYEAMDEAYSRRLSTITRRGLRECAYKGEWTRRPPFGYILKNKKLYIDEREAAYVKYIFDDYLRGTTKKNIAKKLTDDGIRTKEGSEFKSTSVTAILNNPVYKGVGRYSDIYFDVPAIVDKKIFEKVAVKEKNVRHMYGQKADKTSYILTGKLYCGVCGTAMTGDSGTSRNGSIYNYYTCDAKKKRRTCRKKSERKDFLEWYICDQTVRFVLTDEKIPEIAHKVAELAKEDQKNNELDIAMRRSKEVEKEIEKLTNKLIVTDNPLIIKKINERADVLVKEAASLEIKIAQCKLAAAHVLSEDDIMQYLTDLRDGDSFDDKFRRTIINTFVKSVYLFDDKIVIYYNVDCNNAVSYDDMKKDLKSLQGFVYNSGSDSSVLGEPHIELSEHILFIYHKHCFGAIIKIRRE